MLPKIIISGGQTGADRAALDFAIANGIPHGGWCPRGRRAKDGFIPTVYNLKETSSWSYPERTRLNVLGADATTVFNPGPVLSSGSRLTIENCIRYSKPWRVFSGFTLPGQNTRDADELAQFLTDYRPSVLNVAGNSEETKPGVGDHVLRSMARAWRILNRLEPTILPERGLSRSAYVETGNVPKQGLLFRI